MTNKVELFGMVFDALHMEETVQKILRIINEDRWSCHYVVTPNVDHVVQYQKNRLLKEAYNGAELIVADGKPILWAARLLNRPIYHTVPGSDLVPAIFDAATEYATLRIFLLGAAPMVARRAAEKISRKWGAVKTVGTYSPPVGFERDEIENDHMLSLLAQAKPDLLIVGLGAPKQEIWISKYRDRIDAKVAICAGATIDFLAENVTRAPVWMRRIGLEWFYRFSKDPTRLWKRYGKDIVMFPILFVRELYKAFR